MTTDDGDERRFRVDVLEACNASEQVVDELLAYTDNPFRRDGAFVAPSFPLPDEPHVERWLVYEEASRELGAFEALRQRFVQLRFPIREGISQEEPYRRATRRGDFDQAERFSPGLRLNQPSGLELVICPTMAGRIPVLLSPDREDFVALVQAFTDRNEPVPVPASMGACIVKGLNNGDRVAAHRARWERDQPGGVTEAAWNDEFRRLVSQKELYQDRFIILSRGPYSATAASDVGLGEEEWLASSVVIRREHECTHYFTLRLFGVMRNNIFDELIADFVGLARAFGRYRADLALRFLGLEAFPSYRQGGRLESYRGTPPLSDEGLVVLRRLAFLSVQNLEQFSLEHPDLLADLGGLARVIVALTGLTLEGLASRDMRARTTALEPASSAPRVGLR